MGLIYFQCGPTEVGALTPTSEAPERWVCMAAHRWQIWRQAAQAHRDCSCASRDQGALTVHSSQSLHCTMVCSVALKSLLLLVMSASLFQQLILENSHFVSENVNNKRKKKRFLQTDHPFSMFNNSAVNWKYMQVPNSQSPEGFRNLRAQTWFLPKITMRNQHPIVLCFKHWNKAIAPSH